MAQLLQSCGVRPEITQGSSVRAGLANLATLGFGAKSRWDFLRALLRKHEIEWDEKYV
jgi:hypothetical protein